MAEVDRFLALFFRASERRSQPRALAISADGLSGGDGQDAEAAYTAALALIGTLTRDLRITPRAYDVLRGAYLSLTPAHFSVVAGAYNRRASGRQLTPGDPVPDMGADVQSWTDWHALAAATRFVGPRAHLECRNVFVAARSAVADELERRAVAEAASA